MLIVWIELRQVVLMDTEPLGLITTSPMEMVRQAPTVHLATQEYGRKVISNGRTTKIPLFGNQTLTGKHIESKARFTSETYTHKKTSTQLRMEA